MKTVEKTVKVIVEKTKTGFSAYSTNYPVITTGKTYEEIQKNMHEALNLYLEEEDKKILIENIKFELDFKQFFQYYRVINAKFLAERIGMNPTLLSQYVKGTKIPSSKQKGRIFSGINKIGKELSKMDFI